MFSLEELLKFIIYAVIYFTNSTEVLYKMINLDCHCSYVGPTEKIYQRSTNGSAQSIYRSDFYNWFINMYVKRFSWFNISRKLFQMEILIILTNRHKIHEPTRFHENRMFSPKFLALKNEYVTESHLQSLGSQSAYRCYC